MNTKRNVLLSLAVMLVLAMFSCKNETEKVIDIESEKVAIQKIIDEHMDAIDSLDVDRILAVQAEDHLDMPPNMPRIVGKQAYRDYFTPYVGFFESLKYKEMSFEIDEFVVSGDWAFQLGKYTTKFVTLDDFEMNDEGNYVWIFKKDVEGKWKWARVISNSTIPVQEGE